MSTSPPSRSGAVRPQPRAPAFAVLIGVLVVVGAAVGLTRGAGDDAPAAAGAVDQYAEKVSGPGPYRTAPPLTSRAQLAGTFAALTKAVTEQRAADFVEAAGGTTWGRQTWRNLAALGIARVSMRVVDSAPASTPGLTTATVKVSWAPGAESVYDGARTSPRPVTFTLRSAGVEQLRVLRVGTSSGSARPVWLLGPLEVTELRGGAVVLQSVTEQPGRTRALMRRALAAVDEALASFPTSMRRQVVVVAPATTQQAAVLIIQPPSLLEGTTAVTATADGSGRAKAPVQIVLNPAEFDRLDRRGAEVLLAHEATHAATGAAAVDLPLWVAEGFADWVALRDGSVPVRVAAAQLLDSVRADRIPQSLPTQSRFDPRDGGAVESYEAAWTAFRVLERRAGKTAVVGFYADVLAGVSVASALQRNTGLDMRALTAAWRADVGRLARG